MESLTEILNTLMGSEIFLNLLLVVGLTVLSTISGNKRLEDRKKQKIALALCAIKEAVGYTYVNYVRDIKEANGKLTKPERELALLKAKDKAFEIGAKKSADIIKTLGHDMIEVHIEEAVSAMKQKAKEGKKGDGQTFNFSVAGSEDKLDTIIELLKNQPGMVIKG